MLYGAFDMKWLQFHAAERYCDIPQIISRNIALCFIETRENPKH
jgi:hypothetical protein